MLQLLAALLVGLEFLGERRVSRATRAVSLHLDDAVSTINSILRGTKDGWNRSQFGGRVTIVVAVLIAGSLYGAAWRVFTMTSQGEGFWRWYDAATTPYLLWVFRPPNAGGLLLCGIAAIAWLAEKTRRLRRVRDVALAIIILSMWPFFVFAGGLLLFGPVLLCLGLVLARALKTWNRAADNAEKGEGKSPIFVLAFFLALAGISIDVVLAALA